MKAIRTERGLDRLVNFSDATVAIAITLLILPLVDVATEMGDHTVVEVLGDHWGQLLGFLISFWVIGRFWIIHHQVFEWVADYTYGLVWANLLWMSSIVFIPFVANALANIDTTDRPDLYALYIGTMIVTSLSMALIEVILARQPELLREDARGRIEFVRVFVPSGILVLALILAVFFPRVGMFWLLLLFVARPLTMLLRRVFRARGSQTAR
ncbi:TMEM175 family protein [Leifsonia sp. NPDC058292]|uniref:TMEM175 family protein n=1 Tax=Leifsonia sp. NPDC058292 TaxID=3346428 RepID=UPI0036DB9225